MIEPRRSTASLRVERHGNGRAGSRRDDVVVEEPMEIRIAADGPEGPAEHRVAVTMRTPGDDFALAAGFLYSEGLIARRDEVVEIAYCAEPGVPQEYNIVTLRLRRGASFDPAGLVRNFYTTSSCGVCGKASLEAVEVRGCAPLPDGPLAVPDAVVRGVPGGLRAAQPVFDRTGGIHAAGLIAADGSLELLREDVGRHNAVDKVIGHRFLEEALPASDRFLAVSGRASFEILQKALAAGIPMVVAVGAPSSLAVDLARRFNMTLVGFAKPSGYNVYEGAKRIAG
ncbi:MAG: formate dehydrogenase accessory sulfurtransferase FdhD [Gemmatimonadota bacterium]